MFRHPRHIHVGTWVVFLILVVESVYTIPLRQRFFSHLSAPALDPRLVALYVTGLPVLDGAAYVFCCTLPWRFRDESRWACPRLAPMGLLVALAVCVSVLQLDLYFFHRLYPGVRVPGAFAADLALTMGVMLVAGFLAVTIGGLARAREAHARKAQETGDALVEARARLVAAQLDPHNILNVLANAGAMVSQHPERAERVLNAAGYYLRRLLDATKATRIALWQEREIIEDYLSMEAIRMGERLTVEWDWPDDFDDLQVPPILVQPMVENAIKHGLWPLACGGVLRISAAQAGQGLVLEVRNNGVPLASDCRPGATGLENLRQRLAHEYGPEARFTLATDGPWTVATVSIPMVPVCA